MVDIYKNGDGYHQMLHEIEVYKKLARFNLDFIPKFYFDQELYVVHCLVLEYIEGDPCDWNQDPALKAKFEVCVSTLERLGVKHLDLRPENVLVTASGDLKIIDFGLCEIDDQVQSQV
jgi:serine/threonine protein kinase